MVVENADGPILIGEAARHALVRQQRPCRALRPERAPLASWTSWATIPHASFPHGAQAASTAARQQRAAEQRRKTQRSERSARRCDSSSHEPDGVRATRACTRAMQHASVLPSIQLFSFAGTSRHAELVCGNNRHSIRHSAPLRLERSDSSGTRRTRCCVIQGSSTCTVSSICGLSLRASPPTARSPPAPAPGSEACAACPFARAPQPEGCCPA